MPTQVQKGDDNDKMWNELIKYVEKSTKGIVIGRDVLLWIL